MLRLEVGEHVVQRHSPPIAGALGRVAGAGVVDQDLAHGLGGGGEEVAPAGPFHSRGRARLLPSQSVIWGK